MQHLGSVLKQKHILQQLLTGLADFHFWVFGLWLTCTPSRFFLFWVGLVSEHQKVNSSDLLQLVGSHWSRKHAQHQIFEGLANFYFWVFGLPYDRIGSDVWGGVNVGLGSQHLRGIAMIHIKKLGIWWSGNTTNHSSFTRIRQFYFSLATCTAGRGGF